MRGDYKMKITEIKKLIRSIVSAATAAAVTMSVCAAAANTNSGSVPIYSQDFENAKRFQYSGSDGEGYESICAEDGYSGIKCSQIILKNGGYGSVRFFTNWESKWENADKTPVFTEGKTYIMSFKAKKSPDSNIKFYAVKYDDKSYNWEFEFKGEQLSENWKSYNYTFTAASGKHLNKSPALMFRGADEQSAYIDDVRFYEIESSEIGAVPDAEITGLTAEKLTLKYTAAMSDDVLNPKSYIIGGAAASSVTYDETADEYSVVPSAALTCGETSDILISASDTYGRAVNITKSGVYVEYPAETVYTTSLGDETEEIDSIDKITFMFSNTMDEAAVLNKDNYVLSGSDNTVSAIEKVDERTYTVCFDGFLTDNCSYTLTASGLKDKYNRELSDISVSFHVKQVLPRLIESTPSNWACGIPKGKLDMTLKFNKEIKEDSLDEITVSGGAVIESRRASGSTVTLRLNGLKESNSYEVVIKGVCDLGGTEAEETRINFSTELPLTTIYENKFSSSDDIDYRRFGVGGEGVKTLVNNEYNSSPSAVKIEMIPNSDFVMTYKSEDSEYSANDLKIELGRKYIGTFYVKFIEGSSLTGVRVVNGDNKSYINGTKSEETGNGWKKYTYEFVAGSSNRSDINAGKMKAPTIRITGGSQVKGTILFDDWSIKQYPDADVTGCSVSDGDDNVSVSDAISMSFNCEIREAAAVIGNVQCDVSINGGNVVCVPQTALEYGRYYELELVIKDLNGAKKTFKRHFKTEHSVKISKILVNGNQCSNENKMTIRMNDGLSVDVAATGETMYMIAVMYDEDGYMKGAWCKSMTAGVFSVSSADMTARGAEEGDSVKVFFWNDFNETEVIREPLAFTLSAQ